MRRATVFAALFLALSSVLSCTTTSVQTDHDHEADFSAYSSFAWLSNADSDQPPATAANQIIDRRIRRSIAANILSKGLSQAPPDAADLLLTYYVSLDQRLRMYSTGWGYGWGWGGPHWGYGYSFWPGWGYTTVSTYNEGSIIVDIVGREKEQLVWRGVATRVLSKKSSSEEQIDQTMGRLMADFPPL
jgi:hypothetical protein